VNMKNFLRAPVLAMTAGVLLAACDSPSPTAPSAVSPESHASASSTPLQKGQEAGLRKTLCHVTGNGRYQLLSVSASAEPAHRAHGDGAVGERVPMREDLVFDET